MDSKIKRVNNLLSKVIKSDEFKEHLLKTDFEKSVVRRDVPYAVGTLIEKILKTLRIKE